MPTFSEDCLDGQVIVITGGLGALGVAIVSSLLRYGARVAVNDVLDQPNVHARAKDPGWNSERWVYLPGDITKRSDAETLVDRTLQRFGRQDIALCHAGRVTDGPILDCPEEIWDAVLDLNLKGAFLTAQAAARAMVQRKVSGKLIFTSSWVQDVPWPEITPYTVSKSGLKMLMRGMARELAPYGIRANAVAPGIVAAGMAKRQWDTLPEYRQRSSKAIPLGYLQPPDSVAEAIVFLCSSASDYMTGATLLVDGGASLYPMD